MSSFSWLICFIQCWIHAKEQLRGQKVGMGLKKDTGRKTQNAGFLSGTASQKQSLKI